MSVCVCVCVCVCVRERERERERDLHAMEGVVAEREVLALEEALDGVEVEALRRARRGRGS